MPTVILINSSKTELDFLRNSLASIDNSLQVSNAFLDIRSFISWLENQLPPDLIFCGLDHDTAEINDLIGSFNLLCPFVYSGNASQLNISRLKNFIYFLNAPIVFDELNNSIRNYYLLRSYFSHNISQVQNPASPVFKNKIIVRKGQENTILKTEEVAYFYSESRLTFVVDTAGNKYFTDEPLIKLQQVLNPKNFFRISKKYLINMEFIRKFRTLDKGKLEVSVLPDILEPITISYHSAVEFKKRIENL